MYHHCADVPELIDSLMRLDPTELVTFTLDDIDYEMTVAQVIAAFIKTQSVQ
jgi:hypothetical protein